MLDKNNKQNIQDSYDLLVRVLNNLVKQVQTLKVEEEKDFNMVMLHFHYSAVAMKNGMGAYNRIIEKK